MRSVRDGVVIKGCGSHLEDMRTKPRPTKRPKIIAECFTARFDQALVAKDMDEELHNILQQSEQLSLFQYFAMRWAQRMRDYCNTPKSDGSLF
ncbi:hypothetical protein TNCV_3420941 [Trichonephila clavipes]|nr:hypothetical protein TNCV_3420941 [Trichonephila clavipes]